MRLNLFLQCGQFNLVQLRLFDADLLNKTVDCLSHIVKRVGKERDLLTAVHVELRFRQVLRQGAAVKEFHPSAELLQRLRNLVCEQDRAEQHEGNDQNDKK